MVCKITVANSATQYLAKGQTASERFTVTIDDQNGDTVGWHADLGLSGGGVGGGVSRGESFDVMVNDQQGGTATQKVAVTIPEPFNQNG